MHDEQAVHARSPLHTRYTSLSQNGYGRCSPNNIARDAKTLVTMNLMQGAVRACCEPGSAVLQHFQSHQLLVVGFLILRACCEPGSAVLHIKKRFVRCIKLRWPSLLSLVRLSPNLASVAQAAYPIGGGGKQSCHGEKTNACGRTR